MTKPKLLIGGVDLSTRLKAFDASPSGPGVIGSATLSLEASGGGGISILNRMDVKLWLPFNDAGAGVANRGRVFGGLVEDRAEGTIGVTKTWELTLSDWNLLGDVNVRDLTSSVPLSAGTFATQMATLVELVQENGWGVVAQTINATLFVADLHATMPAVTLPGGKKLGWYIQALCLKAQELNTALRPQWYIGWDTSFGATELFGGPVLWVYDGALTPPPAFSFSDAPVGAERKIYNAITRGLESTGMVQRRQSTFNTGAIATYSDTAAQTTYPNPYINHNRAGNTGYWGLEPVEDRESRTFAEAEAKLRGHVLSHSTPRETIEFETPERVKPGEVVTITWPLYSLSAASKRVAGVGTHYEPPDTLWSRVILNRRRSGLFAGEEGIEAPPEEGLPPRPLAVTNLDLPINVYDAARQEAHLVLTFTPSVSNTVARHIAIGTIGGMPIYESTADPTTNEIHVYGPGASSYDLTVVAEDHWGQKSLEFTPHETGTSAPPPAWENVRNPSFEELEPTDAPLQPPRHWSLFGVVGGASSGTSTAQHLGGARSLLFRTTATTQEVKVRSDTVVAQPNLEYSIAVPRRGSVASDALYIAVEWMEGDVIHSTVVLGLDVPVTTSWETGFPAYYPITAPNVATIDGRRLVLGVVTPSVAGDVYVDDIEFVPLLGGRHIADGTIDGGHLASTIDYTGVFTTIAAAESGALTARITDAGTTTSPYALRQQHRLSSGTAGVSMGVAQIFQADSTTTQDRPQARIASSWLTATDATRRAKLVFGTNIQGSDGTQERLGITDSEVKTNGPSLVVGSAALATSATFGFLYLPTSAGKPTGTPVSQTGTVPIIVDTTGGIIFGYIAGVWQSLIPYSLAFTQTEAADGPYSATADIGFAALLSDRALLIDRISIVYLVTSGSHSASHYWIIKLYRDTVADAYDEVATVTTNQSTVGSWVKPTDITSFTNNPLNASDRFLKMRVEATGSPGPLHVMYTVRVREVA